MLNHTRAWVVVPNWNGSDFIGNCLKSLEAQTVEANIVVVDNGSVDDSIRLIEASFPGVTLLKQDKNYGFAGGVNIGIRHAIEKSAQYIALFNNDAVANEKWLEKLVACAEESDCIGIVTGKLMHSDRKHYDSTAECYSKWGYPYPRDRDKKDVGQREAREEVFAATGGASLYTVRMLEDIGMFDERFFAYYEDVDISFRAQLYGWKVAYEPTAVAYHKTSSTSSKLGDFTRYHATKNFFILYHKNMPGYLYFKYLPLHILYSLRLLSSSLIRGKILVWIKAFFAFIKLSPKIIKDRRHIQSQKKVTDKYIEGWLQQ